MVCLEVKGGDVRKNGETNQWYRQLPRRTKNIKNPVAQARNSKHVILDWLKKEWPESQIPYIKMCHGVILPHLSRPTNTEYFGADMPLSMFAFMEDMENLWANILIMMLQKEGSIGSRGNLATLVNLLRGFC